MAIIIPKRGYLTFAELRQRWQCTDNDLRYLVVNGELKPSIKATEGMTQPDWDYDPMGDGCVPCGEVEDGQSGYVLKWCPEHWLYLQWPNQTSAMDCEFRLAASERNPKRPNEIWETIDGSWFWLPKALSMIDIENEHAFFTMDEVLRYEAAHDQDAPPKLEEKQMATRERWPWGRHHTEALGHLEAAAKRWWVNHDPGDIDTAPRNAEVIEWLVNERRTSRAMATSIASILRLDGLPTGPRK